MFKRTDTYRQFIAKYPNAQFLGLEYDGSVLGEVAIGEQGQTAVEVFVGVYRADGSSVAERVITDADLPQPWTIQGNDRYHAIKLAADICDSIAGVARTT